MNIDKAIKILKEHALAIDLGRDSDLHASIHLGIEALKQVKKDRFIAFPYCLNPLPGEAKE